MGSPSGPDLAVVELVWQKSRKATRRARPSATGGDGGRSARGGAFGWQACSQAGELPTRSRSTERSVGGAAQGHQPRTLRGVMAIGSLDKRLEGWPRGRVIQGAGGFSHQNVLIFAIVGKYQIRCSSWCGPVPPCWGPPAIARARP